MIIMIILKGKVIVKSLYRFSVPPPSLRWGGLITVPFQGGNNLYLKALLTGPHNTKVFVQADCLRYASLNAVVTINTVTSLSLKKIGAFWVPKQIRVCALWKSKESIWRT